MQTAWNGYAYTVASNQLWNEVFDSVSCLVLLSTTPGVVTRVQLPLTAHGVRLWTAQDSLWYALDQNPGPIPLPLGDLLVQSSAFVAGAVLLPGAWELLALPNDSLPHEVYMVSAYESPLVLLTALVEMTM